MFNLFVEFRFQPEGQLQRYLRKLKKNGIFDSYLLLTELEGRTVNYGRVFPHRFIALGP